MYDTMQYIRPDVATLCIGQAASMGATLLLAGKKGKRYCLPNSRVMIHQPLGGFRGQATDIEIHAREIITLKKKLQEVYAFHTGKTVKELEDAMERDNFLNAEEAKKFGIVDEVITQAPTPAAAA